MSNRGWGQGEPESGGVRHSARRASQGAFQRRGQPSARRLILGGALVFGTCITIVGVSYSALQAKELPQQPVAAAPQPVKQRKQPKNDLQELIDVVVPVKDIQRGEFLSPAMFKLEKRPKILTGQNTVNSLTEVEGRFAAFDMPSSFPVTRNLITGNQAANELIAQIPDGFRGVSIQTNATNSVEGWARPGSSVDVHWIGDFNGQRASQVIVQNARVLSAERSAKAQVDPSMPVPSTVTLMVPEKDAVRVALASTGGELVLQLRGINDPAQNKDWTSMIRIVDILDGKSEDKVQGLVKLRAPNGEFEEWAMIDGRLHRKDSVMK